MGPHKEHKPTLPELRASLTFPFPHPGCWSPTVATHAVPSIVFQLHTLTPAQRVPNRTSSIPPVSVKAKQPTAASVPECKIWSNGDCSSTSTSSIRVETQDVSMPNCQGDGTSARKLLGEPRHQQFAHSCTQLLKHVGQELQSSQAQDVGTVPADQCQTAVQAACILLIPPHATQGVSDGLCRV